MPDDVNRARALGRELIRVHDWLRTELSRLRDELDDNTEDPTADLTPLQAHCLAFCTALTGHHTSEDTVAFPELADQHPELAAVLDELSQDHKLVEDIVRRLRDLLDGVTADRVESVRREVDGLSAILESHFRWEERKLADVLDAIEPTRPAAELFGLST